MVDAIVDMPTQSKRIKRPNFSIDFKRQVVEDTLKPGASAALVAREHEINANLLFKWRRQYLAGDYGAPSVSASAAGTSHLVDWVPVGLTPQPALGAVTPQHEGNGGVFEITRGDVHVRMTGITASMLVEIIRGLSQ